MIILLTNKYKSHVLKNNKQYINELLPRLIDVRCMFEFYFILWNNLIKEYDLNEIIPYYLLYELSYINHLALSNFKK